MKHTRAVATFAAASALLLGIAAPASAGPPIIEQWTDHVDQIEQDEIPGWCVDEDGNSIVPFDVRYVEDSYGTFRGVTRGGKFYNASTVHIEGSWINTETGKSFGFVRQGQDKDLRIVDNGDGTITVTVAITGPTQYYDDDGNKLFKNVGRSVNTVIWDEAGTPGMPDDDVFVEFVSSESTGQVTNRDFCADVLEFIG